MDEELKKILENVSKSVAALAQSANEISEYLAWIRKRDEWARAQAQTQANYGPDRRFPYLSGRQPRRDGDHMLDLPDEHNPAGSVRPPR